MSIIKRTILEEDLTETVYVCSIWLVLIAVLLVIIILVQIFNRTGWSLSCPKGVLFKQAPTQAIADQSTDPRSKEPATTEEQIAPRTLQRVTKFQARLKTEIPVQLMPRTGKPKPENKVPKTETEKDAQKYKAN